MISPLCCEQTCGCFVLCWKSVTSSKHSHGGRILGFEAGGLNTPSDIRPWVAVGTETQVLLGTDRSSPFVKNPVALRVAILCDAEDSSSSNQCPHRGVGVSNPGFWGMVSRSLNHSPFYFDCHPVLSVTHIQSFRIFNLFSVCLFSAGHSWRSDIYSQVLVALNCFIESVCFIHICRRITNSCTGDCGVSLYSSLWNFK